VTLNDLRAEFRVFRSKLDHVTDLLHEFRLILSKLMKLIDLLMQFLPFYSKHLLIVVNFRWGENVILKITSY
ncbi:MAG: hypothetical protein ACTH80_07275, partial [Alkalibacterium gilvum]|uniref:hypothetical protein n=1 Tax=Alkalibacterium gilvum TaxID=1130080 RepID=UPI003F90719A